MDVMDETIKKVDEMLGKVETGFAVFMDRILKKCKKHLTENSVKALFECAICQETIIEVDIINFLFNFVSINFFLNSPFFDFRPLSSNASIFFVSLAF